MGSIKGAPLAYMSANILSAMRTRCKVTGKDDAHVVIIKGPSVMFLSRIPANAIAAGSPAKVIKYRS